jgi:hypothetical protein
MPHLLYSYSAAGKTGINGKSVRILKRILIKIITEAWAIVKEYFHCNNI